MIHRAHETSMVTSGPPSLANQPKDGPIPTQQEDCARNRMDATQHDETAHVGIASALSVIKRGMRHLKAGTQLTAHFLAALIQATTQLLGAVGDITRQREAELKASQQDETAARDRCSAWRSVQGRLADLRQAAASSKRRQAAKENAATHSLSAVTRHLAVCEDELRTQRQNESAARDRCSPWRSAWSNFVRIQESAAAFKSAHSAKVALALESHAAAVRISQNRNEELLACQREEASAEARLATWQHAHSQLNTLRLRASEPNQLAEAQKVHNDAQAAAVHASSLLTKAQKSEQGARSRHLRKFRYGQLVRSVLDGVKSIGFSAYLQRADPAQRNVLKRIRAEAHCEGRLRAGRKPSSSPDSNTAIKKARHAEREHKRRTRPAQNARSIRAKKSRAASSAANPVAKPFTPRERFHDERMRHMSPAQREKYRQRLEVSRARGHIAIEADLADLLKIPITTPYQMAHPVIKMKDPLTALVAVRGDLDAGVRQCLADGSLSFEQWLGAPAVKRNKKRLEHREQLEHRQHKQRKKPRNRKQRRNRKKREKSLRPYCAAGHLLISFPKTYRAAIASGRMDAALAFQVDSVIARLGLEGHRVAAILHLDSEAEHPHLHIVFARVRMSDDTIWHLDGRSRMPALWLHARAQTARVHGIAAVPDDVDALAGGGTAALSGEVLMEHGQLQATRTGLNGEVMAIDLQGPAAAQRIAALGRCKNMLPGGIALFGLGADPEHEKAWAHDYASAKSRRDANAMKELMKRKPKKRGYWLKVHDVLCSGTIKQCMFMVYLLRGLLC